MRPCIFLGCKGSVLFSGHAKGKYPSLFTFYLLIVALCYVALGTTGKMFASATFTVLYKQMQWNFLLGVKICRLFGQILAGKRQNAGGMLGLLLAVCSSSVLCDDHSSVRKFFCPTVSQSVSQICLQ
jgi:hypothetical protein